jgi:transcriptional regulator with XRE-family HTH domain
MSRKKVNISELKLNKIGGRIAFIRAKADLNQEQFGDNIGLSKSNISQIENHIFEPSFKTLVKIIEYYKINPAWLLTEKGEKDLKNEAKDIDSDSYIYKEGDGPEMVDLMTTTREILESGTGYSDSLAANIRSFHSAVKTEKRLNKIEGEVAELRNVCPGLAERTDRRHTEKDERIRKNDPPEEKEEFINMRATSTG